jgi:hypothetical protein
MFKRCFQNRLVLESEFVSTSLRISPTGSHAAGPAQDVLFRVVPIQIFIDCRVRFAYDSSCKPAELRAIVGSTLSQGLTVYMARPRAASAGRPGKACNPVDCGLPFGSQLPRPLVDWSVSD